MRSLVCCLLYFAAAALGQDQTRIGADFSGEGDRLKRDCGKFDFGGIGSCAHLLFTDHPLHIAVGSLAPLNGFAFGPAFVYHSTPNESWRLSWNLDGVVSTNGSWRAGGYMTAVLTQRKGIGVQSGGQPGSKPKRRASTGEAPVFHVYAQAESLKTIAFYGLGPDTVDTSRSFFGMRQTIVGGNVTWPVPRLPNVAVFAEANGRFVEIRPDQGQTSPSIEQIYGEASAPGLLTQPAAAQFGEGVRVAPSFAGGHVRLNYAVTLRQFAAPGNSTYSFQRLTADLAHQFPIYKTTRTLQPRNGNGPNDCSIDPTVRDLDRCPSVSRNREGSFGLRLLIEDSIVPDSHVVPFYFQPTLGGSDINSNQALASYPDYRFRAPNVLLVRGSFEHSIWGPLGVTFLVDEGKVALHSGDLGFSHLRHTYAGGLTLRAGGLPMVYLMFAWGGREGNHTIVNVNTSLLGGMSRPSLY
jgi:hypothetical protein